MINSKQEAQKRKNVSMVISTQNKNDTSWFLHVVLLYKNSYLCYGESWHSVIIEEVWWTCLLYKQSEYKSIFRSDKWNKLLKRINFFSLSYPKRRGERERKKNGRIQIQLQVIWLVSFDYNSKSTQTQRNRKKRGEELVYDKRIICTDLYIVRR